MDITTAITRQDCESLDQADPLHAFAAEFEPGEKGTLYFDANSVGAMPRAARANLDRLLSEWRRMRRRGWSESDWLDAPRRLGAKLAPILGASADEVIVCDTTSVNLFKALAAALALNPGRNRIVSEAATFPSDLYVAQELVRAFPGTAIDLVDEGGAIDPAVDDRTAVVYLSQVDYRNATRHDISTITRRAHERGAMTVWDLSHGAGAVPGDLDASGADFAVGCGYKYLCGGPGAPAWMFVARRHQDKVRPLLAGWMGHNDPFVFARDYTPGAGMKRFLVGTPAVLANAAMEAACDIWARVAPAAVFAKHASLGDLIVRLVDQGAAGPGVSLASSRESDRRGGFVALRHPHAPQVVAALGAANVIASYRPPDSIRFGLSALYHRHVEVWDAIERLAQILARETWRDPRFAAGKKI
jgi:kynureninase